MVNKTYIMSRYMHLFETVSAFTEQYNGEGYEEPWVSFTEENEKVAYNKKPYIVNLWRQLGNVNPLPTKILIITDDWYFSYGTFVYETVQCCGIEKSLYKDYTDETSTAVTIMDATALTESDLSKVGETGHIHFLWTDPDAWGGTLTYDDKLYGEAYDGEIGWMDHTSDVQIMKYGNTFYTLVQYAD